jgi:GDP/UDP-N,N'-diacetylbacillosamine 2-epimerase (hydrolysing)
MNKKRRVLGITGIRSEYFLQRPIFQAIMAHPELELDLVVTGAHLSPFHNYTVRTVEADGMPIVARIENLLNSDRLGGRLKSAAIQLQILAHVVEERRPDWLFVPCDREEAMTLAVCGTYLNLPMAHYAAGDSSVGNVDDTVRPSVARLCHILLPTHEEARERLLKSGEEPWRVVNVGSSGLDRFRQTPVLSRLELARELGLPSVEERYLVVVQHPLSTELEQSRAHMEATMNAAAQLGLQTFVSYPNSDAGSMEMISVIEAHRKSGWVHVFKNIPDLPFVNLLRGATALLGNSSLGVVEAPFLQLPVVNVGGRQTGRHCASNVFFVEPRVEAIVRQVELIERDAATKALIANCGNPFGDGRTGEKLADLLASTPIDARLLMKRWTY